MIGRLVELSKFDIHYEPRDKIKSQCITDLSAELTPQQDLSTGWKVYTDGSSKEMTYGAGAVLEGPGDMLSEQALKFGFNATNNQVEYKAILVGINLAYDMGAREVTCKSNSQLVVNQIKGEFEVNEPSLQR
ncbi:uncharacterized protein [Phaseolus vulgaris]|uniref:uncharacterized protein n=1 Tax=Phaseolus vulgaris TaxID=3885 RepID=UPI0035CC5D61